MTAKNLGTELMIPKNSIHRATSAIKATGQAEATPEIGGTNLTH